MTEDFPTPFALASAVVASVAQVQAYRGPEWVPSVLEPSAGRGVFVRAIRSQWPSAALTAVEPNFAALDLEMEGADCVHTDTLESYADRAAVADEKYDVIIGNPPFSLAEDHARLCLRLLRPGGTLALVLRLGFLASVGRLPFWAEHRPLALQVLVPRPSFSPKGNDHSEYGLFVWVDKAPVLRIREGGQAAQLDWIKWR